MHYARVLLTEDACIALVAIQLYLLISAVQLVLMCSIEQPSSSFQTSTLHMRRSFAPLGETIG